MSESNMKFTLLTSENPANINKTVWLVDGKLVKESGGRMFEGEAEIIEVETLADFAARIKCLKKNQAIALGLPPEVISMLVTSREWMRRAKPKGLYTRTKKDFTFGKQAGLGLFDADDVEGDESQLQELLDTLQKVAPGLFDAGYVVYPSSSSMIFNEQQQIRGFTGFHIYVPVLQTCDLPRAGAALCDRLWLYGDGRIKISSCGSMLERCSVDGTVFSPERMVYEAGATCVPPLSQHRGEPRVHEGTAGLKYIDTRKVLPDLSPTEMHQVDILKREAKRMAEPEARRVRQEWLDRRSVELAHVDKGFGTFAEKVSRARCVLERAAKGGVLEDGYILYVVEDGEVTQVSVGEILGDPGRYDLCDTLDPLEPMYDNGRVVGRLFLSGGKPRLHSFAMGGRSFLLGIAKPVLQVVRGNTHELVDLVLEDLRDRKELFDRGGDLVQVVDGKCSFHNKPSLEYTLGHGFSWQKQLKTSEIVVIDPPPKVAEQILAIGIKRNLPELKQIVSAPLLLPNRRLIDSEGYDAGSGIYLHCPELAETGFGLPETPDEQEVRAALERVLFPFKDFLFSGPVDRGVYLAALLSGVLRPGIGLCPAFGLDAPQHGSGKTLLANCVVAVASDQEPCLVPAVDFAGEEETRKRLYSLLREGPPVVIWDNVVENFNSPSFAAMLTAETYSDRTLGSSVTKTVIPRTTWLLTGNNLTPAGDIPRRIAVCRIDPCEVDPYSRVFDLNPQTYCRMNRMEMVRDLLTLVRGYWASGAEPAPGRVPSFEEWDALVRQPVAWLAELDNRIGDPIMAFRRATRFDPVREQDAELFAALYGEYGEHRFTSEPVLGVHRKVYELETGNSTLKITESEKRLADAIEAFNLHGRTLKSQNIGNILRYRKGRICGGLQLIEVGKEHNKSVWNVRIVDRVVFECGDRLAE